MAIDTVIFDLDGTLLDTLDDLAAAFNYAMQQQGFKTYNREEVRGFVGNGIRKAFERALGADINADELENFICLFKNFYIEHLHEKTKPYDGILDMLSELKKMKYKTGIVSNKYDAAVQVLHRDYFAGLIDAAIGEGGNIRRKPYPDGIIKIAGLLGSKLDNIIYAGDSEVDAKTAENCTIPCISVLWGFKEKDYLIKYGAKIFAEKPMDIVDYLKNKSCK